jgi:psiF repeat
MQKQIIAALAGALLWLTLPAWSADNSQQNKMTTCNADATSKGLKGDDRKAYMKTCLSADAPAPATGNTQQQKMKTCNADATSKGLKGDDRKTYMKTCLSSGASAGA